MTQLRTEGLTWRVGEVSIVDNVSLELAPGEFLGVIGPNGAGKTSFFNLISGLREATSGRVLLAGEEITGLAPHQRAQRGLGRTFQSSSVFGSLAVEENVRLAAQARSGGSMSWWRKASAFKQVTAKARECLEAVGLAHRAATPSRNLAHGEKRKLEIALLLAGDPAVLLLDEPMAGVSAEDVPELVEVIKGLAGSVLMVEHHMEVILQVADRLAVMHHGALLACDTPAAVMANPVVQEAYLGEQL